MTWAAVVPRAAVRVDGPEAVGYLQGQLSQDVAALEVGGSTWSWLLQPAGKVDALVRVTRTGPDTLVLDTDPAAGETVLNRLTRFKLRTKADIEAVPAGLLALRGGDAVAAAGSGDGSLVVVALWPAGGQAADVVAFDGGAPAVPDGVEIVGPDRWEAARIRAGVPVAGAELTERTIPGETGLVPATVSFTKGCYTGQELVARIDSRGGNVARRLSVLRSASALAAADELTVEGRAAGTVTSAAADGDGWVALAYLGRAAGDATGLTGPGGAPVELVAAVGTARPGLGGSGG